MNERNIAALTSILDEVVEEIRRQAPVGVIVGDYQTGLLAEHLASRGVLARAEREWYNLGYTVSYECSECLTRWGAKGLDSKCPRCEPASSGPPDFCSNCGEVECGKGSQAVCVECFAAVRHLAEQALSAQVKVAHLESQLSVLLAKGQKK